MEFRMVILLYFSYRYWFPANRWPAFRNYPRPYLQSYFKKGQIMGRISKKMKKFYIYGVQDHF